MIASERHLYIITTLNKKGVISLKDIAAELSISEVTVRRDFEHLEKKGKLKRVQGGATINAPLESMGEIAELTMRDRTLLHASEKQKVAQRAAQCVNEGDTVFIDAGTSLTPLADILLGMRVKIVTYSDLITNRTGINPSAEVFLIGGKYLPHYNIVVGSLAQEMLKQFNFDIAFLGCTGVDLETGMAYNTEIDSILMKQIALENSVKKVLLIDSSKLEKRAFVKFTEISNFDAVICDTPETDTKLPESFILV